MCIEYDSRDWRSWRQSFLQRSVVLRELPDALLERGVLGGDSFDGVLGYFVFQVAELSHEDGDAGSLDLDFLVRNGRASSALKARSRQNASCCSSCTA